jgi:Ca-activated chloride channel family protein
MTSPEQLVDVSFDLDREQIARRQAHTVRMVVRVRTREPQQELRRPPLHVVLALDVSASMAGEPLMHAVRSAVRIAAQLQPDDRLGVVAFSGDAFEVAPLRPVGDAMRRELQRALEGLDVRSHTNVEAGLRAAQRMLAEPQGPQRRIVLLLSDGQPNAGADRPGDLAGIAARCEASTSTLGYGAHHDDRVLGAIADGGRGRYAYVPDPELCQLELARALGGHGDAIVVRGQTRIAALRGVRLASVAGPRCVVTGQEATVALPDLGVGAEAVVAAVLEVEPHEGPSVGVADVAVAFRRASDGAPFSVTRRLELAIGDAEAPVRPHVLRSALVAEAEQRRRDACGLADCGRFDDAAAMLRRIAGELRAVPGFADDAAVREAFEQLVDDAELMSRRPDASAYAAFRRGQRGLEAGVAIASASSRALVDDAAGDVRDAELVVTSGPVRNAVFRLRADNLLGRTSSADICLPDGSVSRHHARITAAHGDFWLVDLGSTNTTHVNGRPIAKTRLTHGDELALGCWRLRYHERGHGHGHGHGGARPLTGSRS